MYNRQLIFINYLCIILFLKNYLTSSSPLYGISLTTIPPRFKYINYTLLSWLNQEIKPILIIIIIPIKYKRFSPKIKNYKLTGVAYL
jgi:hypothetical protein